MRRRKSVRKNGREGRRKRTRGNINTTPKIALKTFIKKAQIP